MSVIPSHETAIATYYDRPVLKPPVWIWTVPAYFYVGGLAGAGLVLGSAAQIADENARGFVRMTRWTGFAGTAAGSVFLIADLGRPERFHHMLRVLNFTSPLSIGSWILAGAGAASALSLILPERAGDVAGVAAGLFGIPLSGYTGVLLCNSAVPVWQSSRQFLPALFVASAMASCASLFGFLNLSDREARIVHRFGLMGKIAELMCISAVELCQSNRNEVSQPLYRGLSGALWTASKVLTAASLIVILMPGPSKTRRAAGVLGTLAGIGLRFAVFYAGFSSSRNPKAAL